MVFGSEVIWEVGAVEEVVTVEVHPPPMLKVVSRRKSIKSKHAIFRQQQSGSGLSDQSTICPTA